MKNNERRSRTEGQKGEAEHEGGRRGEEGRRAEGRERLNYQLKCRQCHFSATIDSFRFKFSKG